MFTVIFIISTVVLLYGTVYYRQETLRLEQERRLLINQRNFAEADASMYLDSFNAACAKIDRLEDEYVFTDEPITEIDGTLLQDNTDPTRVEYWEEPCEEEALASGYHYDDDGELVQTHEGFVSDISDAIDSIKWTSQDGE